MRNSTEPKRNKSQFLRFNHEFSGRRPEVLRSIAVLIHFQSTENIFTKIVKPETFSDLSLETSNLIICGTLDIKFNVMLMKNF
jgi:hypothetical protein